MPSGRWVGWFDGKAYEGGRDITLAVDATGWSDIPLFIREGAIIPLQPVMDYVGQHPVTTLDVQIFPADSETGFELYDDDGETYGYEKGVYFLQPIRVRREGDVVTFHATARSGSLSSSWQDHVLAIHGGTASSMTSVGKPLPVLDRGGRFALGSY